MLIPRFKFKRSRDGEFSWIAESVFEKSGRYRTFFAIGRTLGDVKRFAEIVRRCERTRKIEDLGWPVDALERTGAIQSTWGGNF